MRERERERERVMLVAESDQHVGCAVWYATIEPSNPLGVSIVAKTQQLDDSVPAPRRAGFGYIKRIYCLEGHKLGIGAVNIGNNVVMS